MLVALVSSVAAYCLVLENLSGCSGKDQCSLLFVFLTAVCLFCGCSESDCDGCAQDRFNDYSQKLLWLTLLALLFT